MVRSRLWVAFAATLGMVACDGNKPSSTQAPEDKDKSAPTSELEQEAADTEEESVTEPIEVPPSAPADGLQLHVDLQSMAHLADYERHGLSIAFGNPARMKYTVGHWKTGWGKDGVDESGSAFTEALTTSARLYFPLPNAGEYTLRMRVKPLLSKTVQPYLNNAALQYVKMDKASGFADYDVKVPAGKARAGENHMLLRFGDPGASEPGQPLALVSSVRLIPKEDAAAPAAKKSAPAAPIVKGLAVGGYKRTAVQVHAPASLSYYLDVPRGAKLSMRVGAPKGDATVSVRVTPEGGETKELWRGPVKDEWLVQQIALDAYEGQVVRLTLQAAGQGVVGFASPSILIAKETPTPPAKKPKNVVVVLIDTMRADHLQPYNKDTRVKTPSIEALAAQSVVFEAAQSPENWTKPSVASVLTGLYPASHGTKKGDAKLPEKATMVSEVFKDAGYSTATFLANGYVSDKFGFKQGWDYYTNYIREHHNTNAENVYRDATKWIEKHKKGPFFVYIQTIDPHVPYDPPDDLLEMYHPEPYTGIVKPRSTADQLGKAKLVPPKLKLDEADRAYIEALYDGEVTYHDKYLGVFVDRLKKLGLFDNMLFVVTADHGEELNDHQSWGHGHSLYQELIRVPLIVHYPGVKPGRITDTVSTVDIAPTVLSSVGVPIPVVMEGIDRTSQLFGATAPAMSAAVSDFLDDRRTIRAGRWKLVLRGLTPTFFDLKKDPGELVELNMADFPVAVRYTRILLGQFLGARDRGDWLNADPPGESVVLTGDDTDIDEDTAAGLRALGYAN